MNLRTETREPGAMEQALTRLRQMVIEGSLSPGEQIRQQEMAEQFGVSRVPLREALNVLADQGLLQHRPNAGYFVTKRDPGEVRQIRRMLELLEDELLHGMAWPDEALLAELHQLNDQMRADAEAFDWRALMKKNRVFHFRIFALSPDTLILDEVRRLWTLADPLIATKLGTPEASARTVVEHVAILDALKARDREACLAALRAHRSSSNPLPGPRV